MEGQEYRGQEKNVLQRNSVAFQARLLAVQIVREGCPLLEFVGYRNGCCALWWSPPDLGM